MITSRMYECEIKYNNALAGVTNLMKTTDNPVEYRELKKGYLAILAALKIAEESPSSTNTVPEIETLGK